MSEIPIPAEAIEAVARAFWTDDGTTDGSYHARAEKAIRTFLSEMQFEVEERRQPPDPDERRLVSPFLPVEEQP